MPSDGKSSHCLLQGKLINYFFYINYEQILLNYYNLIIYSHFDNQSFQMHVLEKSSYVSSKKS